MQGYTSFRFNRSIEPEPVSVHLDDRLIECDFVGISSGFWFEIRLLESIVDGRSCTIYAEYIKNSNGIRKR